MFYYLYQIINKVNNKIYVGVHKTKDMNDGYMGSGKVIKRAIEKHGTDNFQKDILEFFDNQESMYVREKEIVTEEFLSRDDVYNLRRGGTGGWDYINKYKLNYEFSITDQRQGGSAGGTTLKKLKKGIFAPGVVWHKLTHTDSLRGSAIAQLPCNIEKRKEVYNSIKHQQGNLNSQFGTMWITNGIENKKIKRMNTISEGWRKGRSMRV